MSVNSTMTALADEVRELSGKTGKLTLGNMTDEVASGNETISDQTALIAQIRTALQGKAAGGGTGKPEQEKTVEITKNGEHTIKADEGYTLSKVTANVNVPDVPAVVDVLEVTENGAYNAADEGLDGFSKVTVNVAGSGGGDTGLPAGYRRVDYIQFSDEQVVDTGIVCNQNTQIQLAFTRERSSQHYLYGVASSDNTASVTAYLGGSWRFGNKAATKTLTASADMIYSAVVSNSEVTITGNKAAISGVNAFETIGTLLIGACRSASGVVSDAQFSGKIFFWTIQQGTEQVQKLVPVVSEDGVYRFYDMVTKTFFDSITGTPLGGGSI